MPKKFAFDADPPVMPDKDGNYPIAIPGQYKPY
jgi:myo-inositol 2-dehydrogenase/D-chiro-inositol 1-dehydrogenase